MLEAPLSAGNSSRSRRTLTFVGLLLVISLAAGVSSYIDCISVGYWNDLLDVGSAAMMVQGEGIANRVGDIEDIQGVSAAAALAGAECNLRMDQDEFYVNDPLAPNFLLVGRSYSLSQDYKQDFPDEFVLIEGRWPETETEIAITPTVADQANVGIGALMNYSIELNVGKRPVYVVGIYRQLMSSSFDYYYNSIAVVLQQLLHPEEIEFTVNVAVDRGILNPWSPQDTLSKLVAIERSIIALYPGYPEEVLYSEYHVTNDLAIGVNDYIEWIGHTKLAQVFRSQGLLILTGLFSSLILQYNFEARETELWMHCARGASRQRENRRVVGEVVFLSLLAIFPGLLIGQFILARLAYAAEGFFRINASQYFEAPILFTLDTV
ncbi:MAG: ABC transporter permease, partial [Candidatus Thorarchaeota archaeon]|nr:ABC transporter permease [Candidatus Thorarchaeota archaeon]